MAKMTWLLVLFVTVRHTATCQKTFGVKAAANLSNQEVIFKPSKQNHNKALPGYQIGLFYKSKLSSKWALSGELSYSIVGAKYAYLFFEGAAGSEKEVITYVSHRVGYLEIPLTLQRNFSKFYLGVGPSVSFKMKSPKSSITHTAPPYKNFDIAANLVAGYKITKKLDINVRYSYGLLNTSKNKNWYGSGYENVAVKNRFLNLSLLYVLK